MSNKIMGRVWDHSSLLRSDRLIQVALADVANDYGLAWPGVGGDLAKKTKLSSKTISTRLKKMVASGETIVYARQGHGHHFIVATNMSLSQLKASMKALAKKLGVTTKELRKYRKFYLSTPEELSGVKKKQPLKNSGGGQEDGVMGGRNTGSDDPLLSLNDPLVMSGLPDEKDSKEKKTASSRPQDLLFNILRDDYFQTTIDGGRVGAATAFVRSRGCDETHAKKFIRYVSEKFMDKSQDEWPQGCKTKGQGKSKRYVGTFVEWWGKYETYAKSKKAAAVRLADKPKVVASPDAISGAEYERRKKLNKLKAAS